MINIVSEKEALNIIDSRKPTGRFLIFENGGFTGIDNTTGDAWTESFRKLDGCLRWLNGEELEACQ